MCKRDFFHRHGNHRHFDNCESKERGSEEISHHRFRRFLKKHPHHEKTHHHHGKIHHHGHHRHFGKYGSMERASDEISHHRFRGFLEKHHHHEKTHHQGPRHHKGHMCRYEQPRRFGFERKRNFPCRRHGFEEGFKRSFHGRHSPHHHHHEQRDPIRSQSC